MAVGIAADDVATATLTPDGLGLVPPAPVHLTATVGGDMLELRWVRCARGAAAWRDGVDVPLGEERELYRVTLDDTRTVEVGEPVLRIAVPATPLVVAVRQIGTNGASAPATLTFRPETK